MLRSRALIAKHAHATSYIAISRAYIIYYYYCAYSLHMHALHGKAVVASILHRRTRPIYAGRHSSLSLITIIIASGVHLALLSSRLSRL